MQHGTQTLISSIVSHSDCVDLVQSIAKVSHDPTGHMFLIRVGEVRLIEQEVKREALKALANSWKNQAAELKHVI